MVYDIVRYSVIVRNNVFILVIVITLIFNKAIKLKRNKSFDHI